MGRSSKSEALDPTWTGISSLANQAAAVFHEMQPHIARGRWILMGECIACPLAIEIARLAGECGLTPTKMVLLDPWMPHEAGVFTRMKAWWQNLLRPKTGEDLSADPLPERISLYYKMLKSTPPRPINRDLHLVVSSDEKKPPASDEILAAIHAWQGLPAQGAGYMFVKMLRERWRC